MLSLHGVPLKEVARRTWAEMRTDDVFGKSAQLAYYFFLALFPFLICVIASLSVIGSADRGRALLFALFARLLPGPASQLISQAFNGIIQASGPMKMSLGIVASVWSASLGMGAMMDTLNAAYNVKETRSLAKQYGVAIGLTCGIGLLLVISVALMISGERFTANVATQGLAAIGWRIIGWLVALTAAFLALAATYYYGPNVADPKWRWITPGAVAAVFLLMAISVGSKIYIHHFGTYDLTYGSLGAVIVLLLFFYLSGVAVLFGGVLNAVLESVAAAGLREAKSSALDRNSVERP